MGKWAKAAESKQENTLAVRGMENRADEVDLGKVSPGR